VAVNLADGHIAIYLPSLHGGGAERMMVALANGFAQRGLTVDMVLAKAEGPYLEELATNVRVVDLGAARVAWSLPPLVRYLRRERPVAMLSAMTHANVIATLARAIARVPVRLAVSERNTFSRYLAGLPSLRARAFVALVRLAYARVDAVLAVSQGVADDLAHVTGLPRQRIEVVHNPVVSDWLLEQAAEPLDHPWFRSGAPPVVLSVGRLTTQKDFPTLLDAFARVRRRSPCRLIILGDGNARDLLETKARELGVEADVAMPGFEQNPFRWMRRASVFVLSSAWEGLPGVLIQAMACGSPVVSTDCPSGPAEILEGGRWGRLVPVGDAEALAEAITETLEASPHPDVVERAKDFGVDHAIAAYLRVLGISLAQQ